MSGTFESFDHQMRGWAKQIVSELNATESQAASYASTISQDILAMDRSMWPNPAHDPVPLRERLHELYATAEAINELRQITPGPHFVRVHVQIQNYMAFVYGGDILFKPLRNAPAGSLTRRTARFLTDNPIRAFRNAVAHGNWCYSSDYSAVRFWARKGSDPNEPLVEWSVANDDLGFWQAIARCMTYTTLMTIEAHRAR